MPHPPQFWTPAFIEAFVEGLNGDEQFRRVASGFSETSIFRCLGHPRGEDIEATYLFRDGEVGDVELWIEAAPSRLLRDRPFEKNAALARATAPYEAWVELDRNELASLGAVPNSEYAIEGPTPRIMARMPLIKRIGRLPTHRKNLLTNGRAA